MHRTLTLILALLMVASASLAAPLKVFVSIPPQKTFVERIAGDLADVEYLVPPGASPATYEPRPRQMAAMTEASVYFAIGVPFERVWLDRIGAANPTMRIVHTENAVERVLMPVHGHDTPGEKKRGHANDRHDGHGFPDPHIWLAPPLVKTQARIITEALSRVDPANSGHYSAQYELFTGELDTLDRRIREILAPVKGKAFMVFHPSWGYFASTYGLQQIAIEIQGGEPSPRELSDLIQSARKHAISTIFIQPQFSRKSAETIARTIGAEVVAADPLARDWDDNLLRVARSLRKALD